MKSSCCFANESTLERFLRVLLGLGLLALASETNWGYFGFIPLATGATGICPLYSLIGLNRCKKDSGNEDSGVTAN